MFRTSWVHHQEDSVYTQFCMICFSRTYIISLAGGRVSKHTLPPARLLTPMHNKHNVQKLRLHAVFLMMHPWGSKHVADVKNRIKTLVWKVCISLVYAAWLYQNARCKKHEKFINFLKFSAHTVMIILGQAENAYSRFLRNVGIFLPNCLASCTWRS
jgi:ATP/ADP translocase